MTLDTRRKATLAGWGILALLVLLSLHLAVERIFQVDEAQYAFLARLQALGRRDLLIGAPVILVGPMTWIAGAARSGVEVLVGLRLLFVGLMWVNTVLLVKGCGLRLRSREGFAALLLASTLAPMWDYGFEIRHDVVLVTGTLALWTLVRVSRMPETLRLLLVGFLATTLQFVAFKAFMYTVPLVGLALLGLRGRRPAQWLRPVLALLAGLAAGALLCRGILGLAGLWPIFWHNQGASTRVATTVTRFGPGPILARLLSEAPLLACASLAALVLPFLRARGEGIRGLLRSATFPEWAFAAAGVLMLLANPTPFFYNLIHLVPPLFILAMAHRRDLLDLARSLPDQAFRLLAGTLVLLQALPFAVATFRHVLMDNERQCALVDLAEALTDPATHHVMDGSGLVTTRQPLGPYWLIHTFTIANYSNGVWPPFRQLLAELPTPVILTSYRTTWIAEADQTFIADHYVALGPDIMVLGCARTGPAVAWEALAAGRYQVVLQDGQGHAVPGLRLDGREVAGPIQVLARGEHRFDLPAGTVLRVTWVGPRLSRTPVLPVPEHGLFVNWY